MAEYNCPAEKVASGVCRFLKPSAIQSLGRDATYMESVNDTLTCFKMWTQKIGVTERLKIAMDAKFFSIVGRLLLECGVPQGMEGSTPEGAAYWIAVEVLELPPENFSVPMSAPAW